MKKNCSPPLPDAIQVLPRIKKALHYRPVGLEQRLVSRRDLGQIRQRNHAARYPGAQNHHRSMDLLGDDVRIDENAGAHNAAHYNHGGVKQPQAANQTAGGISRAGLRHTIIVKLGIGR